MKIVVRQFGTANGHGVRKGDDGVACESSVLELRPPLIVTPDEIDRGISILATAFDDAINGRVDQAKVAEFAGW